jgi:trimethylamine:corrinoid methyltransferase-like protein
MKRWRQSITPRCVYRYVRGEEVLYTRLAEPRPSEEWGRDGRLCTAERAQAEAERLLKKHEVPPLTDEQELELDEIMIIRETTSELVGE